MTDVFVPAAAIGKAWQAMAIGEMKTELAIAQMALADLIALVDDYEFTPGLSVTEAIVTRKAIAVRSVGNVVEVASEGLGGGGF